MAEDAGCRVWVGNVAYSTTKESLKTFCAKAGKVNSVEIKESGGRSKGWGIAEFDSPDGAQRAIKELTDQELDGRRLLLKLDKEPQPSSSQPGARVDVQNLSTDTTWKALKDYFRGESESSGVVYADVIKANGASTGNGVVAFETAEQAQAAQKKFDNTDLDGSKIVVQISNDTSPLGKPGGNPKQPKAAKQAAGGRGRGRGGRGGGRGGGGDSAPRKPRPPREPRDANAGPPQVARRVYVGNLSYRTSWQNLKDYFREVGNVVYCDVMRGPDKRSKGCGIVEFETKEDAQKAIDEKNDSMLQGRKIFVREDREDRELKEGGKK